MESGVSIMSSRHVGNALVSLTHFSSCDSSPPFDGRRFDLSAVFLCVDEK